MDGDAALSEKPLRDDGASEGDFRPGWLKLLAAASAALAVGYAVIFVLGGASPADAAGSSLANVVPLALVAAVAHSLLKQHVLPMPARRQFPLHVASAALFALAWYSLVLMALGIVGVLNGAPLQLRPFQGPAFAWQSFQGLVLYALVAATTYALRGGRQAAPATIVRQKRDHYLVRKGEGLGPIAVGDIVIITGAQDYSEVVTADGRYLVRLSLAEFEADLDPARFLRVHRSAIINLTRLERTEPAGSSRMLAWMDNGESVPVSRAGARALRALAV